MDIFRDDHFKGAFQRWFFRHLSKRRPHDIYLKDSQFQVAYLKINFRDTHPLLMRKTPILNTDRTFKTNVWRHLSKTKLDQRTVLRCLSKRQFNQGTVSRYLSKRQMIQDICLIDRCVKTYILTILRVWSWFDFRTFLFWGSSVARPWNWACPRERRLTGSL